MASNTNSTTNRPMYVPKRQRKQQQQNFRSSNNNIKRKHAAAAQHDLDRRIGAYFRSDDWTNPDAPPSSSLRLSHANNTDDDMDTAIIPGTTTSSSSTDHRQQQQRVEDFMDEQDHNEWGGPVAVRREYASTNTTTSATAASNTNSKNPTRSTHDPNSSSSSNCMLASSLLMSSSSSSSDILRHSESIGYGLLKQLGWRGSSSSNGGASTLATIAYVPTTTNMGPEQNTNSTATTTIDDDDELVQFLSKRRLRKIVYNETGLSRGIPSRPWKNAYGLGYVGLVSLLRSSSQNPHHQQKQASSSNVYKVSNLWPENMRPQTASNINENNDSRNRPASESDANVDDFVVGYKSTAGFALRDDEYDAYDDNNDDDNACPKSTWADERSSLTVLGLNMTNTTSSAMSKSPNNNNELQIVSRAAPRSDPNAGGAESTELTIYNNNDDKTATSSLSLANVNSERKSDSGTAAAASAARYKNAVAYEHIESSDEDDNGNFSSKAGSTSQRFANNSSFAGALASWVAKAGSDDKEEQHHQRTSVVGGFIRSLTAPAVQPTLFRGPDVPSSWMDPPHVFGPNEHPRVYQTLAHAVQLQIDTSRRQAVYQESLDSVTIKPTIRTGTPSVSGKDVGIILSIQPLPTASQDTSLPPLLDTPALPPIIAKKHNESTSTLLPPPLLFLPRPPLQPSSLPPLPPLGLPPLPPPPPPSNSINNIDAVDNRTSTAPFAGVRAAMKSRFTMASQTQFEEEKPTNETPGPMLPSVMEHVVDYSISRTVLPFYPEPLLSKRFGLKSLTAAASSTLLLAESRTRDEAYFHDEILPEAQRASAAAAAALDANDSKGKDESKIASTSNKPLDDILTELAAAATAQPQSSVPNRPSMAIFHSIFEPDDETNEDPDADETPNTTGTTHSNIGSLNVPETPVPSGASGHDATTSISNNSKALVLYKEDSKAASRRKDRKKGSSSKKRADRKDEFDRTMRKRQKDGHSSGSSSSSPSETEDPGRSKSHRRRKRNKKEDRRRRSSSQKQKRHR